MKKWIAKWIVSTTTADGRTFCECFDTFAGAKVYAAAVKDLPGSKTTITRI